jgi:hypothetical protein
MNPKRLTTAPRCSSVGGKKAIAKKAIALPLAESPSRLLAVSAMALLIVAVLSAGAPAFAAKRHPSEPGSSQGTSEEQAACSPDATRFCSEEIPDNFRVLACLQQHRHKLRKACLKVLESHGQ